MTSSPHDAILLSCVHAFANCRPPLTRNTHTHPASRTHGVCEVAVRALSACGTSLAALKWLVPLKGPPATHTHTHSLTRTHTNMETIRVTFAQAMTAGHTRFSLASAALQTLCALCLEVTNKHTPTFKHCIFFCCFFVFGAFKTLPEERESPVDGFVSVVLTK